MKNKWLILAAAVALTAFSTAQATQISGTVEMSGTAQLNNTFLGSATAATSFTNVTVGAAPSGTFLGTVGSAVAWHAFSWTPSIGAAPLWIFTNAGTVFSFDLTSDVVNGQNNFFLNLLGTGVLHATGFDDTPGAWSFTISDNQGAGHSDFLFTFANSQTAVVPDGGATVMLLGAALSALALFRKKLIA